MVLTSRSNPPPTFMSPTVIASGALVIVVVLMTSLSRGSSVSSKLLAAIHRLTTNSRPAAMAATTKYSSAVSGLLPATNVPEVASENAHHVTKNGRVVGYKNPHNSYEAPHVWDHVMKSVFSPLRRPPTGHQLTEPQTHAQA